MPPGWGAAAKHLGQGLLAVSHPSFAPLGSRDAASLPGPLPMQGMEMLQVQLRCPFCLLLKGSLIDLHLFGRLPSLPCCLHGGGSLCTLHGTRGAGAPCAPACPVSPHTATSSSRLGRWGGWHWSGPSGFCTCFAIFGVFFLLQFCVGCGREGSSSWSSRRVTVCRLTNVDH